MEFDPSSLTSSEPFWGNRDAHRPSPDVAIGSTKAGEEVFILAARMAGPDAGERESLRSPRGTVFFHEPCSKAKMSPLVLGRELLSP